MSNLLLVPANATSFRELLLVARYLRDRSNHDPVFILDNEAVYGGRLDEEGIRYEPVNSVRKSDGGRQGILKGKVALAGRELVSSSTPAMWLQSVRIARQMARDRQQAAEICSRYVPRAVLFSDDRIFGFQRTMLAVAGSLGIRAILVPAAYSHPEGSVFIRKGKRRYQAAGVSAPWLNRWVAARFPQQVIQAGRERLVFYPGGVARALAVHGLLRGNPWIMGGSSRAQIAVDGPETRERYLEYGIEPGRISVIGQPSHDELYESWRQRPVLRTSLQERYRLPAGRKLVICAVPQLGEHSILPWERHWAEVRYLVAALCRTEQNVLLSLHPKSDFDQYDFLPGEYGCALAREPLREILPAADVFVASYSSTVMWALLCEIPTIVVDFYGFNYTGYDGLAGVETVTDRGQFNEALDRMMTDEPYYESLQEEQRAMKDRIAPFDGKCLQRLSALVDGLPRP